MRGGKKSMYAKHAIYYLHNSIFYVLHNGPFNEHKSHLDIPLSQNIICTNTICFLLKLSKEKLSKEK